MALLPTILLSFAGSWFAPIVLQAQVSVQEPHGVQESGTGALALHQADLPAVGSPEALATEEAFRSWMDALPKQPVSPLLIDYEFLFEFQWVSPSKDWAMSIDGEITTEILSPNQIHYFFEGIAEFGEREPVAFECDLLLDGREFWISGMAGPDHATAETFRIKGDQALLAGLYREYLDFLPVLASTQEVQAARMETSILTVLDWLPKDLGTYLHPAGYLRFGTRIMTCRRLHREDGVLDADMTLDMGEDSVLGMVTSALESLVANEALSDPKTVGDLRFLRSLGEQLFAHIRFDEATGTPLGMDVSLQMLCDPGDFEGDEEGTLSLRFRSDSTRSSQQAHTDFQLARPVGADDAYDVTPFLQMAQKRMRTYIAEVESDQDADF